MSTLESRFDVQTDGRARDCDGLLNFKRTREDMTYSKLCEMLGGLVMGNERVTVTRDGSETWVTGWTKTDEGFHEEEIWYSELSSESDDDVPDAISIALDSVLNNPEQKSSSGPVDISHETAYGVTVKASNPIRCY